MSKNNLNLIIITVSFILLSIVFYGKCGNPIIDFSRESYIPYQMLQGEKLNQDIFLIYGPFGYYLNCILYKLCTNINMLLFEAHIISYIIVLLFYKIIKKYSGYITALIFTLFFMSISIFSNSIFSFAMPYSYSTLLAIMGVYIAAFGILYKKEKIVYFILGFIAVNKLELFILTLVLILIYDIKYGKFKLKNYCCILIIPIIILLTINIEAYINNLQYLIKMAHTKSITYLYKGMGTYFKPYYFLYNIVNFTVYLIISAISYFLYKKSKIISCTILLLYSIYTPIYKAFYLGAFIAIVLTIYNKNKIKKKDVILLAFSLILSSKSIFATGPFLYSNFGWCLLIFCIYKQSRLILNKKWLFIHIIILFSSILAIELINHDSFKKKPYTTPIGKIYLQKQDYYLTEKINRFIDKNISKDENFIVVPEGQIFNLIHKKPWKYYNSTFTPLDFDTFGENNIINELKKNKTDYIIFYPRNTKEYGAQIICYDYGIDFCTYIMDNYTRVALFENNQKALIFKINEKK